MRKSLLIINLGTPNSLGFFSVWRYLSIFLMDKRVITLPFILRSVLVHGFILPFRIHRVRKAYEAIWDGMSPLLQHSIELQQKLKNSSDLNVALAMRYSKPSIKDALNKLLPCNELIILPLYPQYSSAATGSAIEAVLRELALFNVIPSTTIISHFYAHEAYIAAQADLIKLLWEKILSKGENNCHIIFSYHSIPKSHVESAGCYKNCKGDCIIADDAIGSDCYRQQCFITSTLLAKKLHLNRQDYSTVFQSRVGRNEWIGPDLIQEMRKIRKRGVDKVLLVIPSFVTDCLETLEELGIRACETWKDLGGKEFVLAPSLNSGDKWVDAILKICSI